MQTLAPKPHGEQVTGLLRVGQVSPYLNPGPVRGEGRSACRSTGANGPCPSLVLDSRKVAGNIPPRPAERRERQDCRSSVVSAVEKDGEGSKGGSVV